LFKKQLVFLVVFLLRMEHIYYFLVPRRAQWTILVRKTTGVVGVVAEKVMGGEP
jgi:hypothetical protein